MVRSSSFGLRIVGAITTAPLTFGVPPMLAFMAASQFNKIESLRKYELCLMVTSVLLAIFLMAAGLYSNCIEITKSWAEIGTPFSCATISHAAPCYRTSAPTVFP